MPSELSSKIHYFKLCYRADSTDLSIQNIFKTRKDRRVIFDEEETLANNLFPRLPVCNAEIESIFKQAEMYQRERRLIYGCFLIHGILSAQSGFTSQNKICSPLFYFPAYLEKSGEYFVRIDTSDLQINRPLLRSILKPDRENKVLESFPALSFPVCPAQVASISSWLGDHTFVEDLEEVARWPKLKKYTFNRSRALGSKISASSCLVLADRARGSRGVLHELGKLGDETVISPPVKNLLHSQAPTHKHAKSHFEWLPGEYNDAQKRALHNAASRSLSLISGPPGTGKSFTIAAIAIDRILQGETVLVACKTKQAVSVIGDKLKHDFGLHTGLVTCTEKNYQRSIISHLESILSQGIHAESDLRSSRHKLIQCGNQLSLLQRRITRSLQMAYAESNETSIWQRWYNVTLKKIYGEQDIWQDLLRFENLQTAYSNYAIKHINAFRHHQLYKTLKRHRQDLIGFLQALKSRNSKTQAQRLKHIDFSNILFAFPIWLSTLDELSRILPFVRELFNVVIIDEATQCDMASALPAIQRGKKAVIAGDTKQLRHISFLSRHLQQTLWKKAGGNNDLTSRDSYRDNSLLDFANHALESQASVAFLNEHYRSKPEIIAFSNERFYANRLVVMRTHPAPQTSTAVKFLKIDGHRSASGTNSDEKNVIMELLIHHVDQYKSAQVKPSIGILSPYREQAEYLEKHVLKQFTLNEILDFKMKVATPFGFQGEERDYLFISIGIDAQSKRAAAYLNREDMFNVATTRAKELQTIIHSVAMDDLPHTNLLRQYWDFHQNRHNTAQPSPEHCTFSENVRSALTKVGIKVWQGYPIAGETMDLVCVKNNTTVALDLIGYPGPYCHYFDIERYKAAPRAGIKIIPIPYNQWLKRPDEITAIIVDALSHSPKHQNNVTPRRPEARTT